MKKTITFLLLIFHSFLSNAQSSKKISDYINSQYSLDTLSYKHYGIRIVKAKPLTGEEKGTAQVWVILLDKEIYLGQAGFEHGFYIPSPQPLNDFFVLVDCSEYNGNILLFDKNKNSYSFPGYYFSVDTSNKMIYTKASGDSKSTISSFDLKTKLTNKKDWNNSDDTEPWTWKGKYYIVNDKDWIK